MNLPRHGRGHPAVSPPGILVCLCLSLTAAAGSAQTAVAATALERCVSIPDDSRRLACYDSAMAVARDSSAPTRQQPPSTNDGNTTESEHQLPGIDAFGVEQVEDRGFEIPDEIRSRLIGRFTGWRGNTVFRLENGQVWRQSEQDRLVFQADAPVVTIRRGAFGSYRLSIEGINSSVRVRRVE